jgi:hypothetical protein
MPGNLGADLAAGTGPGHGHPRRQLPDNQQAAAALPAGIIDEPRLTRSAGVGDRYQRSIAAPGNPDGERAAPPAGRVPDRVAGQLGRH